MIVTTAGGVFSFLTRRIETRRLLLDDDLDEDEDDDDDENESDEDDDELDEDDEDADDDEEPETWQVSPGARIPLK